MKIIVIKKKFLYLLLYISLIILILTSLLIYKYNKKEASVFNPLATNKDLYYDLTGDGKNDTLRITKENGLYDIQIVSKDKIYNLSSLCNNVLSEDISNWPIKVYLVNVSRNSVPEILVQGYKYKKPVCYLFGWTNEAFTILNENSSNVIGVIDSNTKKTPQFITLESSTANSSKKAYMFQDNERIDITNKSYNIPDLDNILSFINLIQANYELDQIPNIFTENIAKNELSLLWSLDKDNCNYSFQNGFFYDDEIDKTNNLISLKWNLSFEKYNKQKPNAPKEEIIFTIKFIKDNNSFKVSSISKVK